MSKAVHGACIKKPGGYRCATPKGVLWVKPAATGKLCSSRVSLAAISKVCLGTLEGTASEASLAMGRAIQQRFDPNATYPWQIAAPKCKPAGAMWACTVDRDVLHAAATVQWKQGQPVVAFTSFVCSGDYVGRPGC